MLLRIQENIIHNNLANTGTPILVACSGGIDSMVLCDVLLRLNFKIAIAHCNFQLRGKESNADEKFVAQFAKQHQLEFHSIKFDTTNYKKNNSISTQMAARELRYNWFEQIRKENKYHSIATAHHLDDQVETLLLNITKGAGIKGLTGIPAKNGFIIRPLLKISKQEILDYASLNKIAFREDSSNASDDYQRNLIRHQITPYLEKINPSFHNSIDEFIGRMNDYQALTNQQIESIKKKCLREKNGIIEIKLGYIKAHFAGATVLFHLIKEFGFNIDVVQNILKVKESGKQFFSETHRIIIDRKNLFIATKNPERDSIIILEKIPSQIIFNNYKIQCTSIPIQEVNIKTSNRYAYFDADKIELPLIIRYAKEADYFYPFGLSKPKTPGKAGKKKLSKYFKDEKFTLLEKENTPIIFSGEKVIYLVKHRIDDRFKISEKTKNVLKMVIIDDSI
ncbi:MAG TPA: tRNA lysidine(34) synthetase TilS [Chitinophagales bacterium]|nr:tRNA lysidine(34) synthetase TilS [Chitinophagales bacterium]HMW12062.1 tRNA lysidine(34) synthetase TilS [Chitinophagales bacterium]HMX59463.1 tRNA lysidine(34) synthetase TilS [Chitinophagales bacterium]HMZ32804.1 tRNA lysidine(34) synthetase TilS [Chitinophagales bacterium]HNB48491.1 tRNA lysidine(34) synthetase TilS [Chitinophagales bacterium]